MVNHAPSIKGNNVTTGKNKNEKKRQQLKRFTFISRNNHNHFSSEWVIFPAGLLMVVAAQLFRFISGGLLQASNPLYF
jgi:hypothetical protein